MTVPSTLYAHYLRLIPHASKYLVHTYIHGKVMPRCTFFSSLLTYQHFLISSHCTSSRSSRARAPSHYSYRSGGGGGAPSVASTVKTRTSRKGGVTVETMAAPNPFCPNIKGMCCLMLLLNLGIILVTLGFVIVIQFFEPVYVW